MAANLYHPSGPLVAHGPQVGNGCTKQQSQVVMGSSDHFTDSFTNDITRVKQLIPSLTLLGVNGTHMPVTSKSLDTLHTQTHTHTHACADTQAPWLFVCLAEAVFHSLAHRSITMENGSVCTE